MDKEAVGGWRLAVSQKAVCRASFRCGVLVAALALASCGGGGSGSKAPATPAAIAPRGVPQSDLEIAQNLYGGAPRTPAGFSVEATAPSQGYIATLHLKNSDLEALDSTQPLYELCTNDWNEALAWSESSAQQAAQYADLVATNDDPRFFEFGRSGASSPDLYTRARVFKCAYLDRSAANLRASAGPAGKLNRRPLSADELKSLSEYLWQFTAYNNFGHVVLQSAGRATADGFEHTLHIGSVAPGGVSSTCDRIDVVAWRHALNTSTGALERSVATLWSFGARENAGVAELCSASG